MTHPVLTALGLGASESGTWLGNGEWSTTSDAGVLEPVNPTTGEVLGRVQASSQADYELIVDSDEPDHRLELLHTNVRKYGTVSNTLAAAVTLTGIVRRKGA